MDEIEVIRTVSQMHRAADKMRAAGLKIGLVPTMGFFHEGHLGLMRLAGEYSDRVVVSIFVNPIQFGPNEDLEAYPRDFERDLALVRETGGDLVYAPAVGEMYPADHATYVEVERLGDHLCGASRPGHFRGVTTVVAKLLSAVKPHVAVFGQKDAQQVAVIRRMVRDLNLDVEVLVGPTVREDDGLAMSSRNSYLGVEERREAGVLYRALREAEALVQKGERRAAPVMDVVRRLVAAAAHAEIDYAVAVDPVDLHPLETLSGQVLLTVAARFGKARLIDNLVVDVGEEDGV